MCWWGVGGVFLSEGSSPRPGNPAPGCTVPPPRRPEKRTPQQGWFCPSRPCLSVSLPLSLPLSLSPSLSLLSLLCLSLSLPLSSVCLSLSPSGCNLRMAAFAIYLCLGTWFLLNLIASFSGLKSRVASKQGQHQFNLITPHCSLQAELWLPGPHARLPAQDGPSRLGGLERCESRAEAGTGGCPGRRAHCCPLWLTAHGLGHRATH